MMVGKHHITFGFARGTWLKNSAGLLDGTGKNLGHVKVKSVSDINSAGLRELLRESAGLKCESPMTASMCPKR
jgi:hypothetical protein